MNSMTWKLAKLGKFMLVRMDTSDVEKTKNLCEQNFKGDENNKPVDEEDTQRSYFNS